MGQPDTGLRCQGPWGCAVVQPRVQPRVCDSSARSPPRDNQALPAKAIVLPAPRCRAALEQLVDEGLVRGLGIANASLAQVCSRVALALGVASHSCIPRPVTISAASSAALIPSREEHGCQPLRPSPVMVSCACSVAPRTHLPWPVLGLVAAGGAAAGLWPPQAAGQPGGDAPTAGAAQAGGRVVPQGAATVRSRACWRYDCCIPARLACAARLADSSGAGRACAARCTHLMLLQLSSGAWHVCCPLLARMLMLLPQGVITVAHSCLGRKSTEAGASLLAHPVVARIAGECGRTPAQVRAVLSLAKCG